MAEGPDQEGQVNLPEGTEIIVIVPDIRHLSHDSLQSENSHRHGSPTPGPESGSSSDVELCANPDISTSTEKRPSAKRTWNVEAWKKNVKSRDYNLGKVKKFKEEVRMRRVRGTCNGCRLKCNSKISSEEQATIHSDFWSLGTAARRHDFIASHVKLENTKRKKTEKENSRRKYSFKYYLTCNQRENPSSPFEHKSIEVCKSFFLMTLDISDCVVQTAKKRIPASGVAPEAPARIAHNRTSQEAISLVREHIDSFPRVEGYFSCGDSKNGYLEPGLNVARMHLLYMDWFQSGGHSDKLKVSKKVYSDIFKQHYNLGFQKPCKDPHKEARKKNNVKRRTQTGDENERDENSTAESFVVHSYDIQQLLTLPKLHVGETYSTS